MEEMEKINDGFSVTNNYLLQKIVEFINPVAGETILDFGCGRGDLSSLLKDSSVVYGIDNSSEYLSIAQKRGLDNLILFNYRKGKRLPFKDSFFDKVVCFHVLEHINPDLHPLLIKEFFRVLKKNGRLAIGVPTFGIAAFLIYLFRKPFNFKIKDHFGSVVHKKRITRRYLFGLLKEGGGSRSKYLKNVVVQDKLNFKNKNYYNLLFNLPFCLDILVEFKKNENY